MAVHRGSIKKGIGIGILVTAAVFAALVFISSRARTSTGQWTFENPAMGALLIIGIVQIVWVVPLSLAFHLTQRTQTLVGFLIVAAVLFALNAVLFVF